jgi:dolichol-phosphate mannosyltransferase
LTSSIDAHHGRRFSGKTSYTFRKRLKLALDIIISFSERPLKFSVTLGLILSLTSILFAFYIAYKALTTGFTVLGWPSIVFSILFTAGVNLTIMGIIGIYLGRVFNQVKGRPLYVIDQKINY